MLFLRDNCNILHVETLTEVNGLILQSEMSESTQLVLLVWWLLLVKY